MQSEWMKTRQTKYTLYVTVYLLVIVAVLGAANWLANQHNKSIDSTSNKKFSLCVEAGTVGSPSRSAL